MLKDLLTNEYLSRLEVLDMALKKRLSSVSSAGARKSSAKGSSGNIRRETTCAVLTGTAMRASAGCTQSFSMRRGRRC